MLWPKLIALNLDNETVISHKVKTINFDDEGKGYLNTYLDEIDRKFHINSCLYNKHKPISRKRYATSYVYDKLKEIILNNNMINIHATIEYQVHPTIGYEIVRLC